MNRILAAFISTLFLVTSLTACRSYGAGDKPSSDPSGSTGSSFASAPITVISRESGSGTRGAFTELFGVLDESKNDNTVAGAEITNSTSVMMTSVAGDPNAIGYISLGSLSSTVKALSIDGVEATVQNINNGSYSISRPFIIAAMQGLSSQAQDFMRFIMSAEGQDIVGENGYIRVEDNGPYTGPGSSGSVIIAGSSSVNPVMEKLIEAYRMLNPAVDIQLQQSDSSTGMTNAIDGVCDIGMASRALKDSELGAGLEPLIIAMDGIAVIVNNDNAVSDLSTEQVKSIFTGEITNWSELT